MFLTRYSMLWLAKNSLLLALVVTLSSCGFKPMYAKKGRDGTRACSNFAVEKIADQKLSTQRLRYKLQDALNQACINTDKNYRITVEIIRNREASSIEKDRTITRYNLNIVGNFNVFEGKSDKAIYNGASNMIGGFDTVVSDYGTYALEQDTEMKLMEEMANDMALRISSGLLRKKSAE